MGVIILKKTEIMKIKSKATISREGYQLNDVILKNHRTISGALSHIQQGKYGFSGTIYIDEQEFWVDKLTTVNDIRRAYEN